MSETNISLAYPKHLKNTCLGRCIYQVAKTMAVIGGVLFIALVLMSCYSLVARKLGGGGLEGDIEIMQMGAAFASSLFLPFCTIWGENIKVDFFTAKFSPRVRAVLDVFADILLGLFAFLLAWRSALQTGVFYRYEEVSPLLEVPMWIPSVAILPGLLMMGVCAFCCAFTHNQHKGEEA